MSNSRALLFTCLAVLLVACGGGGSDSGGHGNKPPVARFSVSPTTGAVPLAITASGAGSTDADGTIVQYNWDFGDGTATSGPGVQHT